MKEKAKKAKGRPFMAFLLCAMMMAVLLPMMGAEQAAATEPYDLTAELVDLDGVTWNGSMTWDVSNSPLVWDDQTSTVHREIAAEQYLKVTNVGTYAWNWWYLNLSSPNMDLSIPGTWYVTHGTLDDYTNTTTQTLNVPGGMEVLKDVVDRFTHDDNQGNDNAIPALEKNIVKMEQGVGNDKTVTKYNEAKIGTPNQSPVAVNYSLASGNSVYFHFVLVMDALPPEGDYTVNWVIRGFDTYEALEEMTDYTPTRAVASDTETGSSTLAIVSITEISLSYTGTHTTEVYFTQLVGGATTVASTNNLRVTNTGNTILTSVTLNVGTAQVWLKDGSLATTYQLSGNTQARKVLGTYSTLSPSATYTLTVAPGGLQDFDLQLLNAALAAGTYTATVDVTGTSSTGSNLKTGNLVYVPYSGNLACSLTYTTGTALAFPTTVTPGATNVATTNEGIITNTAASDYTVDTIEFLFGPLTYTTNSITMVGATLTVKEGTTPYTYTLQAFLYGGTTMGRALVTLGGVGQPTTLAPGENFHFTLSIPSIPTGLAPGSYSGSFLVTCSANPIQILEGTYLLGDTVGAFEVTPWADPVECYVNDTVQYGATIDWERGVTPWPFVVFRVLDPNGTLVSARVVNITDLIQEVELGDLLADNLTAELAGGSFKPTQAGNYTVQVYQGVLNGTNVDPLGDPVEVLVTVEHVISDDQGILADLSAAWDAFADWASSGFGIFTLLAMTTLLIAFVWRKKWTGSS